MKDLFRECYDGRARSHLSEKEFSKLFCRVCKNQECRRAGYGQTAWLRRILTQKERLLDHPKFADPRDPRYEGISNQKFMDLFREAVRLEISSLKNDWEPVTAADVAAYARGELRPPQPATSPDKPEDQDEKLRVEDFKIEWEVKVPASDGPPYHVVLGGFPGETPSWSCTCKRFQYSKKRTCKHIERAKIVYTRSRAMGLEETPSHFQPDHAANPPRRQPKARVRQVAANTSVPENGIVLGRNPKPDEPDPWAAPSKPDNVVEVGARIRMGLGKPVEE